MLLTLLKTIILGIVEGITEWLPVSSTGHLILVGSLLDPGMSDAFMEMFNVVIQLGAILAVVILFFHRMWPFHSPAKAPEFSQFASPAAAGPAAAFQRFADRYLFMDRIVMWLKIAVSLLPAIVVAIPFEDWLDKHLYRPVPVAVMLILYGVLFILIEMRNSARRPRVRKLRDITWRDALLLGAFQALAIIPGTSRSGATILGGILIGLSRTVAAEYTFYLAVPTMLGASVLKLAKFGLSFSAAELVVLLTGMAAAFAVSMLTIRFLMAYIRKHDFRVFGYYRIILGLVVLLAALMGWI